MWSLRGHFCHCSPAAEQFFSLTCRYEANVESPCWRHHRAEGWLSMQHVSLLSHLRYKLNEWIKRENICFPLTFPQMEPNFYKTSCRRSYDRYCIWSHWWRTDDRKQNKSFPLGGLWPETTNSTASWAMSLLAKLRSLKEKKMNQGHIWVPVKILCLNITSKVTRTNPPWVNLQINGCEKLPSSSEI